MFRHIFVYRLKCLVRERMLLFWMLVYPMVLATLFSLAFANLNSNDAFQSVSIAVVRNDAYVSDAAFKNALSSVSDTNKTAEQKLFSIMEVTAEQAEADLKDGKIAGYILIDNGYHVVVKESGIGQTILKEFVDAYLQSASAVTNIAKANPAAMSHLQWPSGASRIAEVRTGKADADGTMTYFYALLAMAALFGGFWGYKVVDDAQADLSPQGARVSMAPVHKLKSIVYSMCASVVVHFLSMVALIAYMGLVLGVGFGAQLGFVLIACLASSFMGVSYGACIGSIKMKSDVLKNMILIMSGIILSFLSGMMVPAIKYAVIRAVPPLAYINPANLIADAFYSLYYYSTYTRFFTNIALMLAFTGVFSLIVYFATRRQKYASL
jgi:ABC-2 type transport system permease protein